jgi:hypothetical protein
VSGSRTPQERATTCTAQRQKLDALSCASADKLAFIRGSPHSIRAARAPSPAGCKPLPAGAACSTLGKESQELLAKRTPVPSFFSLYVRTTTLVLLPCPSGRPEIHRGRRRTTLPRPALLPLLPRSRPMSRTRRRARCWRNSRPWFRFVPADLAWLHYTSIFRTVVRAADKLMESRPEGGATTLALATSKQYVNNSAKLSRLH